MGARRRVSRLSGVATYHLWRLLFAAGHDACRLSSDGSGHVLDGAAVFAEGGVAFNLRYHVECTPDWHSRLATICGWAGERAVDLTLAAERRGGPRSSAVNWTVRGAPVGALGPDLQDVDLGFTPATNALAIRRLDLAVGDAAETTAIWLDVDGWTVRPLRQVYRRLDVDRYEYTSPDHDYRTELRVDDVGMVTDYPELWAAEPLAR